MIKHSVMNYPFQVGKIETGIQFLRCKYINFFLFIKYNNKLNY